MSRPKVPSLLLIVAFLIPTLAPAQKLGPRVQYWHENVPGVWDDASSSELFGEALATGDFNADGIADLAIGVPLARLGPSLWGGAVHVLYGRSGTALYPLGQYWYQGLICGEPNESHDRFGTSLAVGDFDGDSVDDLAIGSPWEGVAGELNAGLVQILFGEAGSGLTNTRCQRFHQSGPVLLGSPQDYDNFGETLAAGDFDADGIDDLVVGAPFEGFDLWGQSTGAVQVFKGRLGQGVSANGTWLDLGLFQTLQFGRALAVGDWNGDGFDDLAVGAPVFEGSRGKIALFHGPDLTLRQEWWQDSAGVPGVAEPGDVFGAHLVGGDWNSDGFDDLAVSSPGETLGSFAGAGFLHVFRGSSSGLTTAGMQTWSQDAGSVLDSAESNDRFGHALATGDFNGDGRDDLAVSARGEGLVAGSSNTLAGVVHLLLGSSGGLTDVGNRLWSQNSTNVGGVATGGNEFGYALAAGDFDGDGADDLAVGAPRDDAAWSDAGTVNVLLDLDETGLVIGFP
ncbi:MAG: FG-GAP repeat protein [Thermoanaerobaculia bacterium]|nr:FG-GAP repeat protein [Thermoanaerobaculia bacterium]